MRVSESANLLGVAMRKIVSSADGLPVEPRLAELEGPQTGRFAAPLALGRTHWESGVAVAQELAGRRSGALVFGEGLDAVDDDRAVAFGALDTTPFAAGQVMGDLADPFGLDVEAIQVVNDDIGGSTFAKEAAILEAGRVSGQRRETIMSLFEGATSFYPT